MKITVQDVEYIAQLARLKYSDEEKMAFTDQFNKILEYIQKLDELNTDNVEPLTHVLEKSNVFRNDTVELSLPINKTMENSPDKKGNYFKVPEVFDSR